MGYLPPPPPSLGLLIDRRGGSERATDLTMPPPPPPHTWNTRLNQCKAIFAPSSDSAVRRRRRVSRGSGRYVTLLAALVEKLGLIRQPLSWSERGCENRRGHSDTKATVGQGREGLKKPWGAAKNDNSCPAFPLIRPTLPTTGCQSQRQQSSSSPPPS